MTKYDWSKVPDKVKWIAADQDGWLYPFIAKPVLEEDISRWVGQIDFVMFMVIKANLEKYQGDWTQSLEQRPNQEEKEKG
jgi:hypothetical protein